jgi:hypothetical protein
LLAFQFDQHFLPPLAALASAVGTILLRVVDQLFQRRPRVVRRGQRNAARIDPEEDLRILAEQDLRRIVEASAVASERRELLDERKELRDRLVQCEAAAVVWREKYYGLMQEIAQLRSRLADSEKPAH